MFHIALNRSIVKTTPNQSLGICIGHNKILVRLTSFEIFFNVKFSPKMVLLGVTDETLSICEGHVAGCRTITLVICNDLHFAMLEYTHARVCGAKVDAHGWRFACHYVDYWSYGKKM
ncbi:hypothetical protein B566_EDAN014223, partial [Ephemera danica]